MTQPIFFRKPFFSCLFIFLFVFIFILKSLASFAFGNWDKLCLLWQLSACLFLFCCLFGVGWGDYCFNVYSASLKHSWMFKS